MKINVKITLSGQETKESYEADIPSLELPGNALNLREHDSSDYTTDVPLSIPADSYTSRNIS